MSTKLGQDDYVSFRFSSTAGRTRRLGACVAIFALLFATSLALLHYDDPNSSTVCQICYFAHLPVLGAQIRVQIDRPVELAEKAPPLEQKFGIDRIAVHSSPRAPPA